MWAYYSAVSRNALYLSHKCYSSVTEERLRLLFCVKRSFAIFCRRIFVPVLRHEVCKWRRGNKERGYRKVEFLRQRIRGKIRDVWLKGKKMTQYFT